MVIRQGDIFWIDLGPPRGSEPGYRHPYVVIQNNLVNASCIQTVMLCMVTSNLKRANAPGNVRLGAKEAGLKKPSVVNVSQVFTVPKEALVTRCGTLSPSRIRAILDGVYLLLEPRNRPDRE